MQWSQRVDEVYDEDVGCEDDNVHQQTDAHEVAEAVAARTNNQGDRNFDSR